jgi:hypothetical protein
MTGADMSVGVDTGVIVASIVGVSQTVVVSVIVGIDVRVPTGRVIVTGDSSAVEQATNIHVSTNHKDNFNIFLLAICRSAFK